MAAKNYYDILGVKKDVSKDELKKAFYKLAHKYHPDKKDGDEVKFKEANEAYQTLSDDQKRQQYDAYGSTGPGAGPQGGGGFGGFNAQDFGDMQFDFGDLGDMFGDFFGGGRGGNRKARGADITIEILLSFEEAVFGTKRTVQLTRNTPCVTCKGEGAAPGSKMLTCTKCNGAGKIRDTRASFLGGMAFVRTCDTCDGVGKIPEKKCETCKGVGFNRKRDDIELPIPSGIQDGETLQMTGAGDGVKGGSAGNLYIRVAVQKHAIFARSGDNLVMKMPIKLSDALLGAHYPIDSLDGRVSLDIPEGTQSGTVLRIPNKGVPKGRSTTRGDILVTVDVKIPQKINKKTRDIIDELRKEGF